MRMAAALLGLGWCLTFGCSSSNPGPADAPAPEDDEAEPAADDDPDSPDPDAAEDPGEDPAEGPQDDADGSEDPDLADVVDVRAEGRRKGYRFYVTVRSPDTGCDRYADWWEVLAEDGSLLYRRILLHSHVDEQPFERNGGPVDIAADTRVYVRAHLHPGGYGGRVMVGTAADGFREATDFDAASSAGVEDEDPQPDGCRF